MEINNTFWGYEGVIGRRGFITNYLILTVITIIISAFIYTFGFFFSSFFSKAQIDVFINLFTIFLLYPSLDRRIRDLTGKQERDINFYLLLAVIVIMLCIPLLNFFTLLALFIVEGKISGELPKDPIAKFNWGAFFGTWIWGLFNKSYKTLLMLLLWFTPAAIPFAIICGIKGNEWAYKNKNYETPEQLHKSQAKQAIIWTIIWPIVSIIFTVILGIFTGVTISNYEKKHPGQIKIKVEKVGTKIITKATSKIFTKVEITNDEYKYYIKPQDWKLLTKDDKISMFVLAGYDIIIKEHKSIINDEITPEILNKIKVYSSFNNELLSECKVTKIPKIKGKSDYQNAIKNTLYDNPNPSVP